MPKAIPLWSDSVGPTLTPVPHPEGGARPCVVVCPGGGYNHLAEHEAEPVAERFVHAGFHGAVLRYRVAPHRHPAMIHDLHRAVRLVRAQGTAWGVEASHVAVLGFSAGGHLASCGAVHFDRFTSAEDDLAPSVSARPDAVVLCYPVIDLMGVAAHTGSRKNLLKDLADAGLLEAMSTHRAVRPDSPPAFIWHTIPDTVVPVENAVDYAAACQAQGVPYELHVYDEGPHGIGLADEFPAARQWSGQAAAFLHRYLDPR